MIPGLTPGDGGGGRWRRLAVFLTFAALAACDSEGGRTRPESTRVTVIHAAPLFGELQFRREERLEGTLDYATSSVFEWDSDTYTFNIDSLPPGADTPVRLYSFEAALTEDNDYSILLTQIGGSIAEVVIGAPASELADTEAELIVAHAGDTVGPVDVYVEAPGAVLAAATPRASLDFMESLPPAAFEPGEYEVSLTHVDNPTSVVMTSDAFDLAGGVRTTLTVIGGPNAASTAGALVSGGGADTTLADREARAGVRALQAMTSGDALDVTINGIFAPPLISNVQFGVPSAYSLVVPGSHTLMVTPAGNSGVIEIERDFIAQPGERRTVFIRGDPGTLTVTYAPDTQRLIRGLAGIRVYFGATVFSSVDVFIEYPDTDPETALPEATLTETTTIADVPVTLADYTISVRETGTENILATPVPVEIDAEGHYGVLVTNGAAGSGVDILLLDAIGRDASSLECGGTLATGCRPPHASK